MNRILFCGGADGAEGAKTTAYTLYDPTLNAALQLDLGGGTPECSDYLERHKVEQVDVLSTHGHWDHWEKDHYTKRQLLRPGNRNFFSPLITPTVIEDVTVYLRGLFSRWRWPVSAETFKGKIVPRFFTPGDTIDTLLGPVQTILMPHGPVIEPEDPLGSVTYKIDGLVFATDLELSEPADQQRAAEFWSGAHTLVVDVEYGDDEYEMFRNWGHEGPKHVVQTLDRTSRRPEQVIMTHHNAKRSYEDLKQHFRKFADAMGKFPEIKSIHCAQSGDEYEIRSAA